MKIYEFGLGWPIPNDKDDLFINSLRTECELRNLNFILIDDNCLERIWSGVKNGKIRIKFFLDMASEVFDSKDQFARFVYFLKDVGTKVVDDPDEVKHAADKTVTHFELLKNNIPVPDTVIIRNWEPTRTLTDNEKEMLGPNFIIKPAKGYARKGVRIIGKNHTLQEIEEARKSSHSDSFLLQKMIVPSDLDGDPAWFRVYHIFGEITPCWYNPDTRIHRQITLKEMDHYQLLPVARISEEIAQITRVDWFSCEIAQDRNGKYYAIDYMNDQCAMYPQSQQKDGVPDDLVIQIAGRIVEKAFGFLKGRSEVTYPAIWFPIVRSKDENL